jgi:hypothetical protein
MPYVISGNVVFLTGTCFFVQIFLKDPYTHRMACILDLDGHLHPLSVLSLGGKKVPITLDGPKSGQDCLGQTKIFLLPGE